MNRILIAIGLAGSAVVVGVLGFVVWRGSQRGPAEIGPPPPVRHGRPQGGIYTGAYPRPRDLNPLTTQEAVARRVVHRFTHDTLFDLDPATGLARPALVIRCEPRADGRGFECRLRDAVFATGRPVAVDDVAFALRVARETRVPIGGLAAVLSEIKTIERLGPRRFGLELVGSGGMNSAAFFRVMTGYPVLDSVWFRQRAAQLVGEDESANLARIGAGLARIKMPGPGTGPYCLAPYRSGAVGPAAAPEDELDLVRHEAAWHRSARPGSWNLTALRLRFLRDAAARFAALREGSLDWWMPSAGERLSDFPRLTERLVEHEYDALHLGQFAILWNHDRPGLGDARVRRALTMACDRSAVVGDLLHGHARVAVGWMKPGSAVYPEDLEPLPFDPDRARRELAAAGHGSQAPLPVALTYATATRFHRQLAALLQPSFVRAGVDLQLRGVERSQWLRDLRARAFDGIVVSISHQPWIDPYPYFHSSEIESGRNWCGYRNAEIDRLLEVARASERSEERMRALLRFQRIVHEDQPMTLLAHPRAVVWLDRRFQDAAPGPLGLWPERWWVKVE